MEGAKYVCTPPPRDKASQVACWDGLQQSIFSLFSTDHCPFKYDDPHGKLLPKGKTSFRWVLNGILGVETRLSILFSESVGKDRIILNKFVVLTSANHAKTYGLYPKKAPSRSAPMPTSRSGIRCAKRPSRIARCMAVATTQPHEGTTVTGWPVSTMLRGKFRSARRKTCRQAGRWRLCAAR